MDPDARAVYKGERLMTREDIEQGFIDAGWELDGGFSGHLLIGEDDNLSIVAPQWTWETDEPVFELCDQEKNVSYWVREIPTPRQAALILDEHGGPPEDERGNPYFKLDV
jgi:hypothetical protein